MINQKIKEKSSGTVNAKRIKMSAHLNQCAFHVLSPFIHSIFCEKSSSGSAQFLEIYPGFNEYYAFFNTKGYPHFLKAFAEYYHLKEDKHLWLKVKTFLSQYEHPLDIQVLLGPVLRIALGKVLSEHIIHKNNLKPSFEQLVSLCHQEYWKDDTATSAIDWLRNKKWDAGSEFEELIVPNLDLIANIIDHKALGSWDEKWDEAYQNYCDYLSDPVKRVYICESQLAILAQSFNFDFNYEFNGKKIWPLKKLFNPLATVNAINPTQKHWELAKHSYYTQWDFDGDYEQGPVFKKFYDSCVAFSDVRATDEQYQLIQDTFREQIYKAFTQKTEFHAEQYQVLPSDDWGNNGSLQGLVEIIVKLIKEPSERNIPFTETSGFADILLVFREYYQLDNDLTQAQVFEKLKHVIEEYRSPTDQFMLLSPILRKLIKNQVTRESIVPGEIVGLCRHLNIDLEFYYSRGTDAVSCYDLRHIFRQNHSYGTLALRLDKSGCSFIEKDLDKVLQGKVTRGFAPSLMFVEHSSQTQVSIDELRKGMVNFFKTGKLYTSIQPDIAEINRSKIYQRLNGNPFAATYKEIITAVKHKDLYLCQKMFSSYQSLIIKDRNFHLFLKLSLRVYKSCADDLAFCRAFQSLVLSQFITAWQDAGQNQPLMYDSQVFDIIDLALAQNCPQWARDFIDYHEQLPILLNQSKLYEKNAPIISHAISYLAKQA